MSTILEALRRSEAMRAATGAGSRSTGTPVGLSAGDRGRKAGWLIIATGVVITAGLLTGWLLISSPEVEAPNRLATPPSSVEQPELEPGTGANANVANASRPMASDGRGHAQEPQADARRVTEASTSETALDRLRALSDQRRASAQESKTVWTTGPGEQRASRTRSSSNREVAVTERDPQTPTRTEPPDRTHRMPENTVEWQTFVRYYSRRPPDVVLTAHRYHTQPQKRLAIINMRRYTPGERVAPETVLRDIVPQGVVLRIEGQNVLLEASR